MTIARSKPKAANTTKIYNINSITKNYTWKKTIMILWEDWKTTMYVCMYEYYETVSLL
jgi:hypothetical protein